ncbi:MAG: DUF2723 domain-containing protein [Muribaculaceae bacterium]|nr:DUF2723 domain-containing protein [Muribaculaceae bacterium]
MFTKKYNLINNLGGWLVFLIALVTYWLTLEPTASYWDCGEFIIQADKLEIGHPPGNPIFMLTARFFSNFASDSSTVSVMVNAMSGLLSALTILLLFWTISHLVRRLVVKPGQEGELSITQYLVIMGSALVGSLAYTWSDTFWFSAVEGEVYAFSSFCTALVFWLILKWENRADDPGSDRYLILIAYIIGVSVAVHLLNLLCIPAIVLVFAYRKYKDMNLVKSLIALGISFVIVFFVLYGLVPGFIKVAQTFELFFVNSMHMPFNSGALAYGIVAIILFAYSIFELSRRSLTVMGKVSFILGVTISGMLFVGDSAWIGILLTIAMIAALFVPAVAAKIPQRVLNVMMWSITVIFIGYSSYALILIRSSADTPMNQNAPDNVFDLASYLNREQYGENPLIYGETLYSSPQKRFMGNIVDTLGVREDGSVAVLATPNYGGAVVKKGNKIYAKGVGGATPRSEYNLLTEDERNSNSRLAERGGDYYVVKDRKAEVTMNPELNMLFPRLYSRQHASQYANWVRLDTMPDQLVTVSAIDDLTGDKVTELNIYAEPQFNEYTGAIYYPEKQVFKPSFSQNLGYFFNYQLNHMYLRYFLWNFAGRQNDLNNQYGELDAGNWISGIPFLDNMRLGDQSLLPEDLGSKNKGNNKYYLLPLILGLIGLIWQSFAGDRGIEQFWVVFFLFFMTGIAIVLYLNQTPGQPRERDYAFAGSFYAFAIWIGMGVAGLTRLLEMWMKQRKERRYAAAVACVVGLAVPVQMVSQTWDDHDRSGRYAARDFAINYLESLEPNAIVFCNGDNDTFPLWYVQEVEGVRPDVRIINLSYLNSDWYANQQRMQSYEGKPVSFTAKPSDYAYGLNDVTVLPYGDENKIPADLLSSLKILYSGKSVDERSGYRMLPSALVKIPVNKKLAVERGLVAPADTAAMVNDIVIDLSQTEAYRSKGYLGLGDILMLDIIATNAAEGWPRPIYWCSTVGDEYHVGLTPYLRSTGMTHQLVATVQDGKVPRTDRAYANIMNKYRWGGADAKGKTPYFDETARRMLFSVRNSMVETASQLVYEGDMLMKEDKKAEARKKYDQAIKMLDTMYSRLPAGVGAYDMSIGLTSAQIYCEIGKTLGDKKLTRKGLDMFTAMLKKFAPYVVYQSEMTSRFINPSMTYESRLTPFQYYRIIELYETYGGSAAEVDKILKSYGIGRQTLKKYYDYYYNQDAGAIDDPVDNISPEESAVEIAKYCEIANELASKSPADYAATSQEERYIDSLLGMLLVEMQDNAEVMALLQKSEQYQKLDRERTLRIWSDFQKAHPEYQPK